MRRRFWLGAALAAVIGVAGCGGDAAPASEPGDAGTPGASPPAPTAAALASAGETRAFRDWRAVCDNGGGCVAFGGGRASGWLSVGVPAGPDGVPAVSAGFWPEGGDGLRAPVLVTIDGRTFPGRVARRDRAAMDIQPDRVPALLSALASGRTVTITSAGESASFDISGAAAALLWIDERQGRLDTTTALIRRGDRLASTVPPAPVLPLVAQGPKVDQTGFRGSPDLEAEDDGRPPATPPPALENLAAVKECRSNLDFNPDLSREVSASRLGPDQELWGIPCDAGAYNFSYIYFITSPGGSSPRAITFPTTGEPAEWLTNPAYDPVTRMMTAFDKGRGLGDCGVIQQWIWTGQTFALSKEQVMEECWGMPSDLWPATWRTR